jgi:hypothetical protein
MSETTKRLHGTGGNYLPKLLALGSPGVLERGAVYCATVAHDDWCAIYKDRPCNCDPDITVQTATEALAEDAGD